MGELRWQGGYNKIQQDSTTAKLIQHKYLHHPPMDIPRGEKWKEAWCFVPRCELYGFRRRQVQHQTKSKGGCEDR